MLAAVWRQAGYENKITITTEQKQNITGSKKKEKNSDTEENYDFHK